LASSVLAVPAIVLLIEVLAALKTDSAIQPSCLPTEKRPGQPRVAVVVPAHNEASGIAATIASIRSQLLQNDRVLVVADNCNDDTAAVAEAAGAEVAVRQHATQRGKGYALDHGLRHLASMAPDVVVMVDADCLVGAGCIDQLKSLCVNTGRPVQARYIMLAPPGANARQRISAFAWVVRNLVRPRGGLRLGIPCQLMGAGMAFDWRTVAAAPLASGNIVEDMQLGVDLALKGHPALFAPKAVVTSRLPSSNAAATRQRTRWEHGHLATLVKGAPALTAGAWRLRDPRLFWLALDLCVPPLSLLLMLISAVLALAGAWWWATDDVVPTALATSVLVLVVLSVWAAWWRDGRDLLRARELVSAPVYALRKLPMYLGFFVSRQVEWVRAKRDGER
jgi:cellulose synthase/poly-beta-1,6-N-acetylglucosamine synthase-like glycosyltransferase